MLLFEIHLFQNEEVYQLLHRSGHFKLMIMEVFKKNQFYDVVIMQGKVHIQYIFRSILYIHMYYNIVKIIRIKALQV